MEHIIREMKPSEYPMLDDFLYEAIFQRDETNFFPRSIIYKPEIYKYIKDFGEGERDYCLCTEVDNKIVGAVWVKLVDGYGNIDGNTLELAISLYKDYRGLGIGTEMMYRMLEYLKDKGISKISLSVEKGNYALKMYLSLGFEIVDENEEDYIMVYNLKAKKSIV